MSAKPTSTFPSGPKGHRAYAIGDIHGRLDLLDRLLAKIEKDNRHRAERKTSIIFLGDLIDRGADSKGVIERLRGYRPQHAKAYFLLGNHEEVLLRMIEGEKGLLADWLRFGGRQCLRSYGLDAEVIASEPEEKALARIKAKIPKAHVKFVDGFADTIRFGDYLFVHAGVRPGIALEQQKQIDLRWIRAPFLDYEGDLDTVVVHGHTISPVVEERRHRVGIDTGAYHTGILTCIGIEGSKRWFLDTAD